MTTATRHETHNAPSHDWPRTSGPADPPDTYEFAAALNQATGRSPTRPTTAYDLTQRRLDQ